MLSNDTNESNKCDYPCLCAASLKASSCIARSCSVERPLCSSLFAFFSRPYIIISTPCQSSSSRFPKPQSAEEEERKNKHTFNCSLCSPATVIMSSTYSPKPNCSKAFVICSHAIVFLLSFSLISFASDEMSVMNSTQHSIRRSRASFPKARPEVGGRISVTIFWTVAKVFVSLWFEKDWLMIPKARNCLIERVGWIIRGSWFQGQESEVCG